MSILSVVKNHNISFIFKFIIYLFLVINITKLICLSIIYTPAILAVTFPNIVIVSSCISAAEYICVS